MQDFLLLLLFVSRFIVYEFLFRFILVTGTVPLGFQILEVLPEVLDELFLRFSSLIWCIISRVVRGVAAQGGRNGNLFTSGAVLGEFHC